MINFLKKIFGGNRSKEKKILKKIQLLDNEEKYQKIIDLVTSLSSKEKTPDVLSELARAYNNLSWSSDQNEKEVVKHLYKAVEVFKSIEKVQENNPIWNYRIGYSYFFLNDIDKAKKHLSKGDIEKSADLIEVIDYALDNDISLEAAKLNFFNKHYLYTEEELSTFETYIEDNFGAISNIFHEIVSPDIHCNIYLIAPTAQRNYYTLVTCGMGAYDMHVPAQFNAPTNIEIVMKLPPNWDFESKEEKYSWPLRWMKILARLPIEQETFLGWGHAVPAGQEIGGTNFNGFLLISADLKNNYKESSVRLPTNNEIFFFQMIPVFEEEMLFKLEYDVDSLLEKFSNMGVSNPSIIDVDRTNTCLNFTPTQNENLLDELSWVFNNQYYYGLMPFFESVKNYNDKIGNNIELFSPFSMLFQSKTIKIMYNVRIKSREYLFDYELITDDKYFEQEPIDGYYSVKVLGEFTNSNGGSFAALEVLFLINTALSNKNLGKTIFFDGLDFIGEEEDGTPLLHLLLKEQH